MVKFANTRRVVMSRPAAMRMRRFRVGAVEEEPEPPPEPSATPTYGHWVALENRASVVHTISNMNAAFTLAPPLKGAVLRKFWRDLEGAEDDYSAGFATIDTWVDACEATGRKLLLCLVDKTYRNDGRDPLPDYMADYAVENNDALTVTRPWALVGQRWETVTYVPRLAALINAYQSRYGWRAGWEGIRYPDEQAMSLAKLSAGDYSTLDLGASPPPTSGSNLQPGAPWYNKPGDTPAGYNAAPETTGDYRILADEALYSPCGKTDSDVTRRVINGIQYTSTLYRDALIDLIDLTEATRGNGWFYLSLNYLYGSTNSAANNAIVTHVYNGGSPLRVTFGNNNMTLDSASQISNSYDQVFPAAAAVGLPIWASAEAYDYSRSFTMQECFDWFTKDDPTPGGNPYGFGARFHMIQWFYYDGGTYDFTHDAVAIINANSTFNTTP